jgi:hypothetical protein
MSRLTKRISVENEDVIFYTKGEYYNTTAGEMKSSDVREVMRKLAEYEDLEEQGLLLKLPCKVGDIIYEIVNDEIISFSFQKQWRIARYLEAGIFGKIAFLTKEEAEKALLKRLEGAE